jgi:hypothetical protein
MKVAAGRAPGFEFNLRLPEFIRNQMDNAIFDLQHPGDPKKTHRLRQYSKALKNTLPYDDFHEAGLILQRHENHSAGRAGTLAANHQTRVIDPFAV